MQTFDVDSIIIKSSFVRLSAFFVHRMSAENVSKLPLNAKLKIPTFQELIKSIPTIRSAWRLKTPFQKWCYLYGIGKAVLYQTDHRFFENDQTLSAFIYFSLVPVAVYTISAIYTIFFYIANGEPAKCLPCTCLLTIVYAVCVEQSFPFKIGIYSDVLF